MNLNPLIIWTIMIWVGNCAEPEIEIPANQVLVTIKTGKVAGLRLKSHEGRTFYSFTSIPYGQSTALENRFKPPLPAKPWEGIFNATVSGRLCPQPALLTGNPIGYEDCLSINVAVPEIPDRKDLLPVLVFIHGGGYFLGSSTQQAPYKHMDHDAICVTFNYRLGIFGFLNTEDSNSPGNYGMLDQVLALRWVKENIAEFGGDPELVTIFGKDAGGASVIYHMLSPLSQGLFTSAISQSGSPLNPWAFQKHPLKWAKKVARELECPTDDTRKLFDCLKSMKTNELVKASVKLQEAIMLPLYAAPSVEGPGGEGFLVEDPLVLMKEGKVNRVPLIAGFLQDEGYFFYLNLDNKFKTNSTTFFEKDFAKYLALASTIDPENSDVISKVKSEYFGDVDLSDSEFVEERLIQMLGDVMFGAGISKTLDLFSDANVPTLGYIYSYLAEHSVAKFIGGKVGKYITNSDDLIIQFRMIYLGMNENDTKFARLINSLWTSIAAGRDLLVGLEESPIRWEHYDTKERKYLNLNLQPEMKQGKLCPKEVFWMETIPELEKKHKTKDEL